MVSLQDSRHLLRLQLPEGPERRGYLLLLPQGQPVPQDVPPLSLLSYRENACTGVGFTAHMLTATAKQAITAAILF